MYSKQGQSLKILFHLKQHSMYNLLVRGSDRDGATDGLSSECDCRIKVLDVNDNFPTLEKTSVSCYSSTPFFPISVNNRSPFLLVCEPGSMTCMLLCCAMSCPTLGNPIDCSPPGSSVHWGYDMYRCTQLSRCINFGTSYI